MKLEITQNNVRIDGQPIERGTVLVVAGDKTPAHLVGKSRIVEHDVKGISLTEDKDFVVNPDFDRATLKSKADGLGIEYPKNIPTDKLAAAVYELERTGRYSRPG